MVYTNTSDYNPKTFYYLPYSADKYEFEIKRLKNEVSRLQILNKNSEYECELLREKNEKLRNDLQYMSSEYAIDSYEEHIEGLVKENLLLKKERVENTLSRKLLEADRDKYMYMYDKLVEKYSEHVEEMTTLIVKAEEE